MEHIPVENKTAMPIYVAGLMIPAGETRHFDKTQVPREFWPAEVAPEPAPEANPFADVLSHNVQTVVAALDTMETADIEKLGEMEQTGANRKGVLSAIAEQLLKRAGNPPAAPAPDAPAEGAAPAAPAPEGGTE